MIQIHRVIDGNEVTITLTEEELAEVRRQDNIQWAKDVLANYADMIVDYDTIIQNEEILLEYAERLDAKNMENNGDKELEILHDMFEIREDY